MARAGPRGEAALHSMRDDGAGVGPCKLPMAGTPPATPATKGTKSPRYWASCETTVGDQTPGLPIRADESPAQGTPDTTAFWPAPRTGTRAPSRICPGPRGEACPRYVQRAGRLLIRLQERTGGASSGVSC